MITQEQSPIFTNYGPLATQYLTGGQMGYMPQAQYLTPAEYGAFRTLPGPAPTDYQNQIPGFLQSWMIRSYGAPFGLPKYTFNTYNPAVNQQQYMSAIRRHSSDQMLALGGTVFDFGVSSLALGALGGIPGAIAGLAMPSLAEPVINRVRDLRALQNLTMPKITGGREVNLATGMGFNAASARNIDSFTRMSAAGDVLFKEGDYRRMMQLGIENGMFDYAGSAAQYKDIIKKLRSTMTTVMEVVGSTDFKDLMKEFKRLQTMGADMSQFQNILRKENMFSRMAGMSHSDMVNTYGQQGAFLFSSMGLNNYQGSIQAMGNAAMITQAQRMGLINPAMVARHGGVSGMVQTMTQQDAQAQNKIQDLLLSYLANDSMTGLDRNVSLTDILNSQNPMNLLVSRSGRLNNLDTMMAFQRNKPDLWGEAVDKYGGDVLSGIMANAIGKQVGRSGMGATEFGLRMQGYSPEIARIKAQQLHSNEFQEQVAREAHLARQKRREEEDLAANPFRRLARDFDKTLTKFSESTFGRVAGAYAGFVERSDAIANGYVPSTDSVNSNVRETSSSLADEKTRQKAADTVRKLSLSTDEASWTGGKLEADDWERRNLVMLNEETGGEGMRKISFRVRNGRVSGRVQRDGKGGYRGYYDAGGSSFGTNQFTTTNMISFLNQKGNERFLEAFKSKGVDLSSGSDDSRMLDNIRKKLGDKRLRSITGSTAEEVLRKIDAAGLGLTSEETALLQRTQDAYTDIIDSSIGDDFRAAYYSEAINEYVRPWYALDEQRGSKEQTGEKVGILLQDEGWRRILYDLANNRGAGNAKRDFRAAFSSMSLKDFQGLASTTSGKKQLLDKLYAATRSRLNSGNGAYGRYAAAGRQITAYKAAFDALDGTPSASQASVSNTLDEDIKRLTGELSAAQFALNPEGVDGTVYDAMSMNAYFGSNVLNRRLSGGSLKDDAELLSKKLGMDIGQDALDTALRETNAFDVDYRTLNAPVSRKNEARKALTRLIAQQRPTLNEKAREDLVDALSGDMEVQGLLAAASVRNGDLSKDDDVSRRLIDWKRAEEDAVKLRSKRLNEFYAGRSENAWENYADNALHGLSKEDLATVRTAMSANPRYGQLVSLRALTKFYNASANERERGSIRKEINGIAGRYGMDDQAVERMLRDGTLRADEIKSFSADQKTLDALGDVGARLWEENKGASRLFMTRNQTAMRGANGSVALGILTPNVARHVAGLNELAKKNRFNSAQDAMANFEEFQRRVDMFGSAADKALVAKMAEERKRTGSVDLGKYGADAYTAGAAKTLDAASASAQSDPGAAQADALRDLRAQTDAKQQQAGYFAGKSTGSGMGETMQGLSGTLNTLNETLKNDLVTTLNGMRQTLASLQKKL